MTIQVHDLSDGVAQAPHSRRVGRTRETRRNPLSPAEVRRVAVEAGVEPRTAAKYLRGERVVSTCADRIRRALVTLGWADPTGAA